MEMAQGIQVEEEGEVVEEEEVEEVATEVEVTRAGVRIGHLQKPSNSNHTNHLNTKQKNRVRRTAWTHHPLLNAHNPLTT